MGNIDNFSYNRNKAEVVTHSLGISIDILLFEMHIDLLSHTTPNLQKHLQTLSSFCDNHGLEVNLGKTKTMAFNMSKRKFPLSISPINGSWWK